MKFILYLTLLILMSCSLTSYAQVTIGSCEAPIAGALLDIKEQDVTNGNADSKRGLAMPRVKLTSKTNLYPMFETVVGSGIANNHYNTPALKTAEDAKHTGLIVYHTDLCSMQGKGLYVWQQSSWAKIGDQSPAGLNLSTNILDIPSGHDLRGAITTKTFEVSWGPIGAGTSAPTWTLGVGSLVPNMTPISGALSITSPQTMTVQPAAMTEAMVNANPFVSLSRIITFNSGVPCNQTKNITLNQTNKALRVNGSTAHSHIVHTTNAINQSIVIASNGEWKMSMMTTATAITNLNPAAGIVNGTELNDNTNELIYQKYNITAGTTKDYTTLNLADNEIPKRFNDVKITITQCSGTNDPTMQQWADQLGTTQDEISTNGVAWHKDHEGNIFFSMNYDAANPKGNNNRWMITNLAATSFVSSGRTGSDKTVLQGFGASPSGVNNYLIPLWAYPSTKGPNKAGEFENNQRLGILYNWAASTNSLGGTNKGQDNPTDAQAGKPYPTHRKIQGICPNGWHLPNDYEWTELENEIIKKTSTYSSTPNINGTLLIPSDNEFTGTRGTLHGSAMKDMCEPTVGSGTSHSPLNGGFSALLAGNAFNSNNSDFGRNGYYWSSSSFDSDHAWTRYIYSDLSTLARGTNNKTHMFSVRCKKDN